MGPPPIGASWMAGSLPRMARMLGQSPEGGAAGRTGPGPGGLDSSTQGSAARAVRGRGGRLKGGLDFRYYSRRGHAGGERRRRLSRCLASGAGWVGRFVFHAIAVSFDNECLPVMHQPVDQGRGQGVVDIKQGAPFPEDAIRGQHTRSGFVTGSNYLEQQVGPTLVDGQIAQLIEEEELRTNIGFEGVGQAAVDLG